MKRAKRSLGPRYFDIPLRKRGRGLTEWDIMDFWDRMTADQHQPTVIAVSPWAKALLDAEWHSKTVG